MNCKTLLFIFFIFFTSKAISSPLRDSIGVENLDGKQLIIHKIEPKETYYSLGRKYDVSPQSIMEFNDNIVLHPNDIIKIPTQRDFIKSPKTFSSEPQNKPTLKVIKHKVKPKETLYSIAKDYGMSVEDLKTLNHLKDNNLAIGKILKVTEEVKKNPVTKNSNEAFEEKESNTSSASSNVANIPKPKIKIVDSTDSQNNLEIPKNRYGLTAMNEKGVAVWIEDGNLDSSKSYVLHRTAPVGTIMKITNPMTGKSVFAKVVGRFAENETTKDVLVVLTKAAADAVGALDKRFLVNITFGVPNEQ
ncbi:MAG: LysM peptidoglycan-binding domain-containing protein [Sphingobacteriales bacterium]|nr:LysM peptidoglycan-binding domain-containing protein [Sphingobacteriales bacterium]